MYKIGAHGLTYWQPDVDWIKSTKTVAELEYAVKVRDTRRGAEALKWRDKHE